MPPCPLNVSHVMNSPRPSMFFTAFPLPCIIVNTNRRTQNGLGLPTKLILNCFNHIISTLLSLFHYFKVTLCTNNSKHIFELWLHLGRHLYKIRSLSNKQVFCRQNGLIHTYWHLTQWYMGWRCITNQAKCTTQYWVSGVTQGSIKNCWVCSH